MILLGIVLLVSSALPEVNCYSRPELELPANAFAFRMRTVPTKNVFYICGNIKTSNDLVITFADTRPWFNEPAGISFTLMFKPSQILYKSMKSFNFRGRNASQSFFGIIDNVGSTVFEKKPANPEERFFCVVVKSTLEEEPPRHFNDNTTNGYYVFYTDNAYNFFPYHHKELRMPFLYVQGPNRVHPAQKDENGYMESLPIEFPYHKNVTPPDNTFMLSVFPSTYVRLCGNVRMESDLYVTISDGQPVETSTVSLQLFYKTLDPKFRRLTANGFLDPNSHWVNEGHLRESPSIFGDEANGERHFCFDMKTFSKILGREEMDQVGYFVFSPDGTHTYIRYGGQTFTEPFYVRIEGAQVANAWRADDGAFTNNMKQLERVYLPLAENIRRVAYDADSQINEEPLNTLDDHLHELHKLQSLLEKEGEDHKVESPYEKEEGHNLQ